MSADAPSSRLTAGLVLAVVAVAFEGLAVTTVMPTVVRDLGGLADYGWAFSGFMLANVVGITVAGRRTDRVGPWAPFAGGAAIFTAGLCLAGPVGPGSPRAPSDCSFPLHWPRKITSPFFF